MFERELKYHTLVHEQLIQVGLAGCRRCWLHSECRSGLSWLLYTSCFPQIGSCSAAPSCLCENPPSSL